MHSNKKTLQLFFLLLWLFSINISAQDDIKQDTLGIFSIKTGQSADNDVTRSQPAKAIAIFPRDTTKNSYSINGFLEIGFNLPHNNEPQRSFSIILEQHKNTLISEEQDVFQLGVQWKEVFFFKKQITYKPKITLSGKYSKDNVNDEKGLQILGYLSFYPSDLKNVGLGDALLQNNFTYPGNERELEGKQGFVWSDIIQVSSSHSLGFESLNYEKLSLLHFAYNLEVYPFSGLLYQFIKQYQLLRLDLGFDLRTKVSSHETNLFTGNSIKVALGLNVLIDNDEKQSIGISYSYQKGGDPIKGLANQTFSQLAISAIFSLDNSLLK